MNGSYNPNKNQILHHLECLNRILDEYNSDYDNFVFIGDFNINVNGSYIKTFCNLNGLKSLINEPICFKNPDKPTCIDLILTDRLIKYCPWDWSYRLSLLTVTEFKMGFTKSKPRIINCRGYKKFNNNAFRYEIQSLCSSEADLGFFKESILTFSINLHLSTKSNFAQMKPLLWLKNYTLLLWRGQDWGISF